MSFSTYLKLIGFASVSQLEDHFGSFLVDTAYIASIGEGYVLVAPDDRRDVVLSKPEDFEWFKLAVTESLKQAGEIGIVATKHDEPDLEV